MNIRQEIWTPSTHWKTALNHGDLRKPGLVFCFGNPGSHNAQAIYNEVKHSFPGADLVFGFLENSHEEKLFLTAFNITPSSYTIDKINLNNVTEDVEAITSRCIERKWNQMLLSVDADRDYGEKVITSIDKNLNYSYANLNIRQPVDRIKLGLNEMPVNNTSICLTLSSHAIRFSSKNVNSENTKGATATQSMWDRYATAIIAQDEKFTMHFPFAMVGA